MAWKSTVGNVSQKIYSKKMLPLQLLMDLDIGPQVVCFLFSDLKMEDQMMSINVPICVSPI